MFCAHCKLLQSVSGFGSSDCWCSSLSAGCVYNSEVLSSSPWWFGHLRCTNVFLDGILVVLFAPVQSKYLENFLNGATVLPVLVPRSSFLMFRAHEVLQSIYGFPIKLWCSSSLSEPAPVFIEVLSLITLKIRGPVGVIICVHIGWSETGRAHCTCTKSFLYCWNSTHFVKVEMSYSYTILF